MWTIICTLIAILQLTTAYNPHGSDHHGRGRCRCIPSDPCYPCQQDWNNLNRTVNGQLIRNQPTALVCYSGPNYNANQCSTVNEKWSDALWQQLSPVGYDYPTLLSCPPIAQPQSDGNCTLGDAPAYTVNATSVHHVVEAVRFAQRHNVRFVIHNTGHDLLGRSSGQNALQVWLHYLRDTLTYQPVYQTSCSASEWKGGAIKVSAGYTWSEARNLAVQNNVVVATGGTPSVGAIGGWAQGGGHGPATHDFGLGADQVLDLTVLLADGSIVTANACQHQDLFFALRGGGGGTYGIALDATVKTHATTKYGVQTFAMAPLSSSENDTDAFMDALTTIYTFLPAMSDAGFSGYGSWSLYSPSPLFANFTTGVVWAFAIANATAKSTEQAFKPVHDALAPFNLTSLIIVTSYYSMPTYEAYYQTFSGVEPPVGTLGAVGSRLLPRDALSSNRTTVHEMLTTLAGEPDEHVSNNLIFVAGGAVASSPDPYSGVLPAWRKAILHHIVSRNVDPALSLSDQKKIHDDITYTKTGALRKIAPDSGAYMNEGDRFDPQYAQDFYGSNWARLNEIKDKYDPQGFFFCPTCVGSERYTIDDCGRLCSRQY